MTALPWPETIMAGDLAYVLVRRDLIVADYVAEEIEYVRGDVSIRHAVSSHDLAAVTDPVAYVRLVVRDLAAQLVETQGRR